MNVEFSRLTISPHTLNSPPVPTTIMSALPHRTGRAGIEAILNDIHTVLPPGNRADKPEYKRCCQMFGLMRIAFQKAQTSNDPIAPYREIQNLERTFCRLLAAASPNKGIPEKMRVCLDELKLAIGEVIQYGPENPVALGLDQMEASAESTPQPTYEEMHNLRVEPKVKMVPETRLLKVKNELKEAQAKITELNGENNSLALRVRQLEAERDVACRRERQGRQAPGYY